MCIWALGTLRVRPMDPWMTTFMAAALQQLNHAKPQELTNCAWGLAKLGFMPSHAWQYSFRAAAQQQLPRCTGELWWIMGHMCCIVLGQL